MADGARSRTKGKVEENPLVAALTRVRNLPEDQIIEPVGTHLQEQEYRWQDLDGEWQALDPAPYAARDTYPLPTPRLREGYNPKRHDMYWANGLGDLFRLKQMVDRYGDGWSKVERTFELGCSTGRAMRHIAIQEDVDVWGADIDRANVLWTRTHLPRKITIFQNSSFPSLPVPDAHFDVITAYSVFTHIDVWEDTWLMELRRTLKPGGVAVITFQNENSWRKLETGFPATADRLIGARTTPSLKITRESFVEGLSHDRLVVHYQDESTLLCNTYHSTDYVRDVWSRYFEIAAILPAPEGRFQDVAVLRKPS